MTEVTMTVETARETFNALTETQKQVFLAIELVESASKETLGETFKPQVVGSAIKGLTTKGLIREVDGAFVSVPATDFNAQFGDGQGEVFEPVMIRTRRARSSGVMVQFWKMGPHSYKCVCEHGTELVGDQRYPTARSAANPDQWCDECKALAVARAKAKADKKAERAKAKKEAAKAKAKDQSKAEAAKDEGAKKEA